MRRRQLPNGGLPRMNYEDQFDTAGNLPDRVRDYLPADLACLTPEERARKLQREAEVARLVPMNDPKDGIDPVLIEPRNPVYEQLAQDVFVRLMVAGVDFSNIEVVILAMQEVEKTIPTRIARTLNRVAASG